MKKLFSKLLVDIKKSLGQYLAIIIISMIGVMLLSGMNVVHLSLSNTVDKYYDDCNLADITVNYNVGIDDDGIKELSKIKDVKEIEGRLRMSAQSAEDDSSFLLQTISEDTDINKVILEEGRLPKKDNECVLNTAYVTENKLSVGDTIKVEVNDKDYKFKITGTFMAAEYAYLVENSAESMIPDFKNYGLLYVTESLIEKFVGADIYNQIIIDTKDGADCDEIIEKIKDKSDDYYFSQAILKSEQASYSKLDSDIVSARSMSQIIPYIFFLVAAAIIFITVSRKVQSERTQIGIMKALGISKIAIMLHYCSYAISSCLIGSVLGNIIGLILLPSMQFKNYSTLYILPELKLYGYANYVIISIIVVLIFGIGASYLSVRKTLKEVPAQCLRTAPPKKVHKILLERIPFIWNHFSHRGKLIARNIFLNKKRVLLSSFGIIGCVGLLLCGLGLKEVTEQFIYSQFEEIQRYDAMAIVNTPQEWNDDSPYENKGIKTMDNVSSIPIIMESADDYKTTLYVMDEDNKSIQLFDTNKAKIDYPKTGAVVPYKLSRDYGIKEGDTIKVTLESDLYDYKTLKMKVVAISELYVSQDIYVSHEYMKSLDVDLDAIGYYITFKDADDSDKVIDYINDKDITAALSIKKELREQFDVLYQSTKTTVYLLVIMSACLALTVIFNISSINIFERRRDIATLKVLGYHKKEINSLIDVENFVITLWGSVWGIIFGILIFKEILISSESQAMYYPFQISPTMVIISVAITFIFTLLANFMLRPKIKKIDMVESLKSVE